MAKDDDHRIDEEALVWIARETSGEFTQRDRERLRTWLVQSDRHLRAYAEARALWQDLEGLRGRPVVSDLLLSLDQAQAARGHRRRRQVVAMSLAASVLLSLLVLGLYPVHWWRADHTTTAGERRSISLPDGSTVHLNSQSALAVDYTQSERRIELLAGEAEFEVSPDRRPFVVEAGPARIQALGADFLVRIETEAITVSVIENTVQVQHSDSYAARTVSAGRKLRCDGHRLGAIEAADPRRLTAWRRGKLIFESAPLAEVIAEINRHRPGRVVLMSPQLGSHRVSGVFAIDKIDSVLARIEETLPVRSFDLAGRYVVLY